MRNGAGEHQIRVHSAWPSGHFVACTCGKQSPGTRNQDDITEWTYQHLGLETGFPPHPGAWNITPEGALF
jgi:hypothetical protein